MKNKIIAAACMMGLCLNAVSGQVVLADTNKETMEHHKNHKPLADEPEYYENNDPVSTGISMELFEDLDEIDTVKINGRLPHLISAPDDKFTEHLNTAIMDHYNDVVTKHPEQNFAVDYDVYQYSNLISVVIDFKEEGTTAKANKEAEAKTDENMENKESIEEKKDDEKTDNSVKTEKKDETATVKADEAKYYTRSIVFDRIVLEERTLKDLLGDDYKDIVRAHVEGTEEAYYAQREADLLAGKEIEEQDPILTENEDIIEDAAVFNSDDKTEENMDVEEEPTGDEEKDTVETVVNENEGEDPFISANQSFYVDNAVINVIFDSHTTIGANGTNVVKIPFDHTMKVKLNKGEYFTEGNQEYVPLSTVLRLGMDVRINADRTMDILSDGQKVADLHLDENNYSTIGGGYGPLSSEPILHKGYNVSVPLDFFHSALGATVTRDSKSQIMIETRVR